MNTPKDGLMVDLLGLRCQIIVSKDDGLMAHILHIDSSPRGEHAYVKQALG